MIRVKFHVRRPCPITGEPVAVYRFANPLGESLIRTAAGWRVLNVGGCSCGDFHTFEILDSEVEESE